MAAASQLRLTLERHLAEYEAADGIGGDAYCEQPYYHPMADGKCMQTLAVLRDSQLLSASQFEVRAARVHARLAAAALPGVDEGWGWGLGFSWRDLPATEIFLITSAIVIRGALDCRGAGSRAKPQSDLLHKGMRSLRRWIDESTMPIAGSDLRIAAYSPGIREPIYNAAAYAYSVLLLGEAAGFVEAAGYDWKLPLGWIRSRRIAGLGWSYSPASPVVDLLHQCYTLNAMADAFGVRSIEETTVEMIGQFAGPCCFVDAMRLVTNADEAWDKNEIPWLRPLGKDRVKVLPRPARLWSLGELLVVLSRLGRDGEHHERWTRLGRRIAESIMSRLSSAEDQETRYPRHVMHALHGLACHLALLRTHAQAESKAASGMPDA